MRSADLCSRVTLVNFTVTPGGLRRQTLAAALRSERPDVDEQRADLEKLQGEYMTKLMQCEEALLMALSESEGNILDNDSLIATLERIKGEGKELEDRYRRPVTHNFFVILASCILLF
jgi:dynein heavy chain 1